MGDLLNRLSHSGVRGCIHFLCIVVFGILSPDSKGQLDYGFELQAKFTWDDFTQILQAKKPRSIEETLPLIKEQHPDFFENFILMYRSRSLQEASFQAPRAILFDRSGQFAFSFNGHQKQRGSRALEVMHYKPEQQRFELREVLFSDSSEPRISQPNPEKCLQCHQASHRTSPDPRPNWEPYNIWPGAYGSESGSISQNQFGYFIGELLKKDASDQILLDDLSKEFEEVTQFFSETKPQHRRYHHLGFDEIAELFTLDPTSWKGLLKLKEFAHKTVILTQFFAYLNAERVLRLMQETDKEAWAAFKYPMISQFACGDWQLETKVLDDMLRWVPAQFIATDETRVRRAGDPSLADPRVFSISEQIFILFESHGISIEDWSMDFKTEGRFAFRERFGTPSVTADAFLRAARKLLPKEDWTFDCQELRAKGNQAIMKYRQQSKRFIAWRETSQALPPKDHRALLSTCIRCHDGHGPAGFQDRSIPEIRFSDSNWLQEHLDRPLFPSSTRTLFEEMAHRLSDHATLAEQMPPTNKRPSLAERRALLNYFRSLIQREQSESLEGSFTPD